jgi:hypothetical protein
LNDADSMAALYVALSQRRAPNDDTRAAAAH